MAEAFVALLLLMLLSWSSSLPPSAITKAPMGTIPKIEPYFVAASTLAEDGGEFIGIKAIPFVLEVSEEEFEEMRSRETLRRRRGTRLRNLLCTRWLVIRNHVSTRFKKMTAEERNIVNIYKRALPSVAELTVYTKATDDDDDDDVSNRTEHDPGSIAKESNVTRCSVGTGSGVLWDDQGHIVTNHHVLYGAGLLYMVKVRFPGMVDFLDVEVVGSTPLFDLAVLKVSPTQNNPAMANPLKLLPKPIQKASSKFLQVGQTCLLMGSPNGLFSSALTTGIVSDLGRTAVCEFGAVPGSIQTSGALGTGSSGGPLLDSRGQLIGINFAGTIDYQKGKQQGFAIPIDVVKKNVNQIIRNGSAQSSTIGVSFAPASYQDELGLQSGRLMGGAVITHIFRNSPGDNAGLQECVLSVNKDGGGFIEPRDIVVAADGIQVRNSDELFAVFQTKMPGNTVLLTVSRVASIGDIDRWTEVIPIKLITFDQLSEDSDEYRKSMDNP